MAQMDNIQGDKISVGDIGATAVVAIGRGATATVINNIIYARVELPVALRELFDPLIEEQRATFGGRYQALAVITDFISQEAGGYLVVTAAAGFGKTSLMAALVGSAPNAFAYHFFTPLYGDRSLSEAFFLRNMVQQMAQWHGATDEDVPSELDKLAALYHHYLDLPLTETRIMVLDGLDEVSRWSLAPYLKRRLPDKLHIIVTIRDVGQDWSNTYRFPLDQVTHLPLGGLTHEDISGVLKVAGGQAAQLANDADLLAAISRVAASDPAQPNRGADPFYIRYLAADLADGDITPQQLAQLPQGVDAYLDNWWQAIKKQAGDKATRDLFGTLTAGLGRLTRADLEAINPTLVDDWAGDLFADVLTKVRRFVIGNEQQGYALVHPRLQRYLQDPRRIKAMPAYTAKLLAYCEAWQSNRTVYAFKYAIDHFAAAQQHAKLFGTITDPNFREAQIVSLGDSQPTLDDLKLALELALQENLPLQQVDCVAAYRDTIRNQTLTDQLFGELNIGNVDIALTLAGRYLPAADWPCLLHLYLALEAAFAGNEVLALQAVKMGLRLPVRRMSALADGLVTAVARQLALDSPTNQDSSAFLAMMLPQRDAAALLNNHQPAPPLTNNEQHELLQKLEPQLTKFEQLAAAGDSEAVMSVLPMLEEEARSGWYDAGDMRDLLRRLAVDPLGWTYIERTLQTILPNPYIAYRDIGLQVIGMATLAAPLADTAVHGWLRFIWQQMLTVALDREGIIFTFELPFLLVAEAQKRGLPPDSALQNYIDQALAIFDKWGTRMRAHSARALQAFRQGNIAEADDILAWLAEEEHGYAGFATQHLLMLANRWLSFGQPQRIALPISQWESQSLDDKLDQHVHEVRDAAFRNELQTLIAQHRLWRQSDQAPDISMGLAQLGRLQSSAERSVYVDFLSAQWLRPLPIPNILGLKTLLPLVLDDGTLVDLVLARLMATYLDTKPTLLDDAALQEAQSLVNQMVIT